MKVRYKVVKRKSRRSAMINGNSKYSLLYHRGAVVKAPEGTLGIFVFTTETMAEYWAHRWGNHYYEPKDLMVIEVEPIWRGRKKFGFISDGVMTEDLDDFYKNRGLAATAPEGSMVYPSVRVLS